MSYLDDLKSAIGEDVSFIERPVQKKTPNQKATEQINQLANVLGSEDSSNLKTAQKEAAEESSKLDLTNQNNVEKYLKKNKRIVLIILVIAFIELSGYGILASLSRLLNAL